MAGAMNKSTTFSKKQPVAAAQAVASSFSTDTSSSFTASSSTSAPENNPFQTRDENTLSLHPNPKCPGADTHNDGYFCYQCRAIPMGWGSQLPLIVKRGKLITVGPAGGIVKGVHLHDEEAIAVLCAVVYINCNGFLYSRIPGLIETMDIYPKSLAAGETIAQMYQTIQRAARYEAEGKVPDYWYIVERALLDPRMHASVYVDQVLRGLSTYRESSPSPKEQILEPVFGLGTVSSPVKPADDESESESEDESETEMDDVEGEGTWRIRPFRTQNQSHMPSEKGNWKFADGTDLTPAVLGQPDPSKFFFVRQDKDDLEHFDIREYPQIATFDWNDHNDLVSLNKNRGQIIKRTRPPTADSRPPWTKKEKDVLENLIRADLQSGKIKKTLDWESLCQRLAKYFENVLQKKGSELALKSRRYKGKWLSPKKKDPKLSKDRNGAASRSASACRLAAFGYRDISELIDSFSLGNGTSADGQEADKQDDEVDVNSDEVEVASVPATKSSKNNSPQKKRKIEDVGDSEETEHDTEDEEDPAKMPTPKKQKMSAGEGKMEEEVVVVKKKSGSNLISTQTKGNRLTKLRPAQKPS